MKYYFRHLKIVKINGKDKNYPLNKLLRSNDDDGYRRSQCETRVKVSFTTI